MSFLFHYCVPSYRKHLLRTHPSTLYLRSVSCSPSTYSRSPVRAAKDRKHREKLAVDDLPTSAGTAAAALPPLSDSAETFIFTASGRQSTRLRRATPQPPELPQGLLEDPSPRAKAGRVGGVGVEGEGGGGGGKRYPTVIQQALENMSRLPRNCILLTRVGGFYELYFGHAEAWASRLGLKLAAKKTVVGSVPMAGFPFWQLERFLKILVVEEGRYVAVCEEYPGRGADGEAEGGLMWERRIARIITPGTLIDEAWIEGGENHFLLALEDGGRDVGLAWADLGTGEVWCQAVGREKIGAEMARIAPREVVVERDVVRTGLVEGGKEGWVVTEHAVDVKKSAKRGGVKVWENVVETEVDKVTVKRLTALEVAASVRLLDYVESRLPGIQVKLQSPVRRKSSEVMGIDVNSMRALEIKVTLRDGVARGSLMHTVDRTVTRGGKRLLGNWLTNPSTEVQVIEGRLDLVGTFMKDEDLREDIVGFLKNTHDSQRIVQKFSLGRADADDLVALARTIEATSAILKRLRNTNAAAFKHIISRVKAPMDLARVILNSIDEEGVRRQQNEVAEVAMTLTGSVDSEEASEAERAMEEVLEEVVESGSKGKRRGAGRRKRISRGMEKAVNRGAMLTDQEGDEAWVMKKTASPILREAHLRLQALREAKGHLEAHLRNKLDVQSLTLKWSPNLGFFCHIKGKDMSVPGIRSVSSSRTTKSFLHPEWTKLGESVSSTRLRIRAEEKNVFQSILQQVLGHIPTLRRNARVLDELDIATSFALLSREQNLTRPVLLPAGNTHKVLAGRHITVESGLREQGKSFTANDCFVGCDRETLWLITGPNMAGKSTFLRQNALLSILAQAGCYVPADHAEMSVVDHIFSRVGSADNLYQDQSTFMVEMLETAGILRGATERSLVVMDEVGRGTNPRDGEAVAWAVAEELRARGCRCLFATHFEGVAEMLAADANDRGGVGEGHRVGFYCTDVLVQPAADERASGEENWVFVHKLRKGVNHESHALRVARLAGMPKVVLERAEKALRGRGQ